MVGEVVRGDKYVLREDVKGGSLQRRKNLCVRNLSILF
jgi:hypothetical protein